MMHGTFQPMTDETLNEANPDPYLLLCKALELEKNAFYFCSFIACKTVTFSFLSWSTKLFLLQMVEHSLVQTNLQCLSYWKTLKEQARKRIFLECFLLINEKMCFSILYFILHISIFYIRLLYSKVLIWLRSLIYS